MAGPIRRIAEIASCEVSKIRTRRRITIDSQTVAGPTEIHKVGQRMEIAWELNQELRWEVLEGHDLELGQFGGPLVGLDECSGTEIGIGKPVGGG
jgi:hypothetical protein